MPSKHESQPTSPQFSKLHEMIIGEGKKDVIGTKTSLGTVDVQCMYGVPGWENHIEVQVHTPENVWVHFRVTESGLLPSSKATEGSPGDAKEVEMPFTLDDVLAEL